MTARRRERTASGQPRHHHDEQPHGRANREGRVHTASRARKRVTTRSLSARCGPELERGGKAAGWKPLSARSQRATGKQESQRRPPPTVRAHELQASSQEIPPSAPPPHPLKAAGHIRFAQGFVVKIQAQPEALPSISRSSWPGRPRFPPVLLRRRLAHLAQPILRQDLLIHPPISATGAFNPFATWHCQPLTAKARWRRPQSTVRPRNPCRRVDAATAHERSRTSRSMSRVRQGEY